MTVHRAVPDNVLLLVPQDDPLLYRQAAEVPIDNENTLALIAVIAKRMLATCRVRGGIGLAGPQVALDYRVFVMAFAEQGGRDYVCINPQIVDTYGDLVGSRETCLTVPNNAYVVRRYPQISASWTDQYGQPCAATFSGLQARVFQHELDHLSGRTIWPRLPVEVASVPGGDA